MPGQSLACHGPIAGAGHDDADVDYATMCFVERIDKICRFGVIFADIAIGFTAIIGSMRTPLLQCSIYFSGRNQVNNAVGAFMRQFLFMMQYVYFITSSSLR